MTPEPSIPWSLKKKVPDVILLFGIFFMCSTCRKEGPFKDLVSLTPHFLSVNSILVSS